VNVMRSNSSQNISSKTHKVNRETGWSFLAYEFLGDQEQAYRREEAAQDNLHGQAPACRPRRSHRPGVSMRGCERVHTFGESWARVRLPKPLRTRTHSTPHDLRWFLRDSPRLERRDPHNRARSSLHAASDAQQVQAPHLDQRPARKETLRHPGMVGVNIDGRHRSCSVSDEARNLVDCA